MKTAKNLFPGITSFENLVLAARKAAVGKRSRPNVQEFLMQLEYELCRIQDNLKNKTYVPGAYREFLIFDPKKRMISAAPFRDRVVHHALCNIIAPLVEGKMIYDSYANRKGKGVHRAVTRYQTYCRKYEYVLKCDIKKYFPSIDHAILKQQLRRIIACPETLWLIDTIIDGSNPQVESLEYFPGDDLLTPLSRQRGLPIGNLTSQFFANIYLNRFDHFVKETLRCKAYIRYVDDFVVFSNNKSILWEIKREIESALVLLRLKLHPDKGHIHCTKKGLTFLGYRIFPAYKRIKRENIVKTRRRLRKLQQQYRTRQIDLESVERSLRGWLGHAMFANTWNLRRQLFDQHPFKIDKAFVYVK